MLIVIPVNAISLKWSILRCDVKMLCSNGACTVDDDDPWVGRGLKLPIVRLRQQGNLRIQNMSITDGRLSNIDNFGTIS